MTSYRNARHELLETKTQQSLPLIEASHCSDNDFRSAMSSVIGFITEDNCSHVKLTTLSFQAPIATTWSVQQIGLRQNCGCPATYLLQVRKAGDLQVCA